MTLIIVLQFQLLNNNITIDDIDNNHLQCIVYLKSVEHNKNQWFIYDKENNIFNSFDMESNIAKEDTPLFI